MKIIFILLVSGGVVWSYQPSETNSLSQKEKFTIYLTPGKSVVQVEASIDKNADKIDNELLDGSDKQSHIFTQVKLPTTITTNRPVTENYVPIDLSQRLFYANHQDSQRSLMTLDLSGLDLSGEDVMKVLHGLNSTTLDSVAQLDLSHNRVSGLPSRVWPLQLEYRLRELRLDHNKLDMYDPTNRRVTRFELLRLLSLQKLSLSHCALTSGIEWEDLAFPPVESLDLSGNRLLNLLPGMATLSTLRHLDVSGNNLRYLGGSPLSSLTGLRTLNLSHNNMEIMWDDPIEKLCFLDTLHLDHNSLTEPPKLCQYTGSYQPRVQVYMSANAFKCGCSFKNTLDKGRIQVVDKFSVKCEDDGGVEWSVDNGPASQCSPRWEAVREKWSGAKQWFQNNRPGWSTLYRSLGWVLFGLTLGLVYAHRRVKKTPPPSRVPYNILDDQAVC